MADIRTRQTIELKPLDEDRPISRFQLVLVRQPQYRRKGGIWHDDGLGERTDVGEPASRRDLVEIIERMLDWLAYEGGADT